MLTRETVIVQYKTKQSYCSCCNQELPSSKTSDIKEFVIDKDMAESWTDWEVYSEFQEDIDDVVDEFVHTVIRFHSTNSYEKLIIEDSEIEKVKAFIVSSLLTTIQGEQI